MREFIPGRNVVNIDEFNQKYLNIFQALAILTVNHGRYGFHDVEYQDADAKREANAAYESAFNELDGEGLKFAMGKYERAIRKRRQGFWTYEVEHGGWRYKLTVSNLGSVNLLKCNDEIEDGYSFRLSTNAEGNKSHDFATLGEDGTTLRLDNPSHIQQIVSMLDECIGVIQTHLPVEQQPGELDVFIE